MIGNAQAIIAYLFQQNDNKKLYEIREKRNRRSLTQNAYYWALLNQLANAIGMSSDECHKLMMRRYGVHEVVSLLSEIDPSGYFKYYDQMGYGYVDGKRFTHYRIYKGSSQMDSKEFATLLEGVRSECEEVGIVTLTPEEISRLKFVENGK